MKKLLVLLIFALVLNTSCEKNEISEEPVNRLIFKQQDLAQIDLRKAITLNVKSLDQQTIKSEHTPYPTAWMYNIYIEVNGEWKFLTEEYYPLGSAARRDHVNPAIINLGCGQCANVFNVPLNRKLLIVINSYEEYITPVRLKYTGSAITTFTRTDQSLPVYVWDQASLLSVNVDTLKLQGLKFKIKISSTNAEHKFDYKNLEPFYIINASTSNSTTVRYTFSPSGGTPVVYPELTENSTGWVKITTPAAGDHVSIYGNDFKVEYKIWDETSLDSIFRVEPANYSLLNLSPEKTWIKPSYFYKVSFRTDKHNDNTRVQFCTYTIDPETVILRPVIN